MSALSIDKMEQETSWTFPVEPPVHVVDPYKFGPNQTWSLITKVKVCMVLAADGESLFTSTAIGVAATKAGARRGTYTGPVYGDEAQALATEAMNVVVERSRG